MEFPLSPFDEDLFSSLPPLPVFFEFTSPQTHVVAPPIADNKIKVDLRDRVFIDFTNNPLLLSKYIHFLYHEGHRFVSKSSFS